MCCLNVLISIKYILLDLLDFSAWHKYSLCFFVPSWSTDPNEHDRHLQTYLGMTVNCYSLDFALGPHAECFEHKAKIIFFHFYLLLVCQFDHLGKVEEITRAFAEIDSKSTFSFSLWVVDVSFLASHLGRTIIFNLFKIPYSNHHSSCSMRGSPKRLKIITFFRSNSL